MHFTYCGELVTVLDGSEVAMHHRPARSRAVPRAPLALHGILCLAPVPVKAHPIWRESVEIVRKYVGGAFK